MGDPKQPKPINSLPLEKSKYWDLFEKEYIPDIECRRYINPNGSINIEYRDMIIELANNVSNDIKCEHQRSLAGETPVRCACIWNMRAKTKLFITKMKWTNKMFGSLFNHNTRTADTWFCPTKVQVQKRKKPIIKNSEIIYTRTVSSKSPSKFGNLISKIQGKGNRTNGERDIITSIGTDTMRGKIKKQPCYFTEKGNRLWKKDEGKLFESLSSMTISKTQGLEFGLDKKVSVSLNKISSICDLYLACSRVRNENSINLSWK